MSWKNTTLSLAAAALVTLAANAASAEPFKQGSMRLGLGLGTVSNGNDTNLVVGAGFGYYVINGIELGLDFDTWIGANPSVTRLTPGLLAIAYMIPTVHPYAGVFYSHRFIGAGFDDIDSVGARGGIAIEMGPRAYGWIGAYYETIVSECEGDDCSYVNPEVRVSFVF